MDLQVINKEINSQLADKDVHKTLLATTFKGFEAVKMKQAIMEGMIRGFTFKDFLEKNVYAISYGNSYSLITSIDYARKIAMRSGLAGKSEPKYTEDEKGNILTCTVTVKRNVNGVIGDYTATVYFKEYTTNKNLWTSKPRTMIAKVAEMHALRSAFPEEMAQQYVEEEMESEKLKFEPKKVEAAKVESGKQKLEACKSLDELRKVFKSLSLEERSELEGYAKELSKEME